jgi:hypothetical protein
MYAAIDAVYYLFPTLHAFAGYFNTGSAFAASANGYLLLTNG